MSDNLIKHISSEEENFLIDEFEAGKTRFEDYQKVSQELIQKKN